MVCLCNKTVCMCAFVFIYTQYAPNLTPWSRILVYLSRRAHSSSITHPLSTYRWLYCAELITEIMWSQSNPAHSRRTVCIRNECQLPQRVTTTHVIPDTNKQAKGCLERNRWLFGVRVEEWVDNWLLHTIQLQTWFVWEDLANAIWGGWPAEVWHAI